MSPPTKAGFPFALVILAGAAACQPNTPCSQAAAEIRETIEACGGVAPPYPQELDRECTPEQQALAACLLDCYQETSCSDLLKKGTSDCVKANCL